MSVEWKKWVFLNTTERGVVMIGNATEEEIGLPKWLRGKESACQAVDPGSISGSGNDDPLWYACLGNLMDWRDWQAIVHGVAKNQTQLSDSHFLLEESEGLSVFCQQSQPVFREKFFSLTHVYKGWLRISWVSGTRIGTKRNEGWTSWDIGGSPVELRVWTVIPYLVRKDVTSLDTSFSSFPTSLPSLFGTWCEKHGVMNWFQLPSHGPVALRSPGEVISKSRYSDLVGLVGTQEIDCSIAPSIFCYNRS